MAKRYMLSLQKSWMIIGVLRCGTASYDVYNNKIASGFAANTDEINLKWIVNAVNLSSELLKEQVS